MGSLRLRPSRAALRRVVARAMDIAREEMATSTSANLHVLGTEDSGAGGAETVADVRVLEGGYEARGEGCCQGPSFVSPFSVLLSLRLIHLSTELFASLIDSCARTRLLVFQVRAVICSIFSSHACRT